MLPSAPPLTRDAALRWAGTAVPRWVPKNGLTLTWLAAFFAAVLGDTLDCAPDDPAICGPDTGFALWLVVMFATPVLLLWRPLAGCATGIAFAAAVLVWDDTAVAPVAFGIHGLLCAAVAVWLVRAARAQEAAVREVTGGATVAAPPGPPVPRAAAPWVAAGLLVASAPAMLAWYAVGVRREDDHLARAVRVEATVVAIDGDYDVTVQPPDGRRLDVEAIDNTLYEVGESVPVYLDPRDEDWVRLVAEPRDTTYWVTGAVGAIAAAGLLVWADRSRRAALVRLRTGEHPAMRVLIRPADDGDALVLPAEGEVDRPVARFRVRAEWTDETTEDLDDDEPTIDELEDFARAWRGEQVAEENVTDALGDPEPAVLLGSLRDGGWALLVTEEQAYEPHSPLRVRQPRVTVDDLDAKVLGWLTFGRLPKRREAEPEYVGGLPGIPVTSTDALVAEPELPLVARRPRHQRVWGVVGVVAAYTLAPVLAVTAPDTFSRVAILFGGLSFLVGGTGFVRDRVRLTRERIEVQSGVTRVDVPWDRVIGVRRHYETLAIAWQPDEVIEVGPFDGGMDRAKQLGAAMELLRQRALAAGAPGREARRSLAVPWLAVAAYAAVVAVGFRLV